jgi:hypothetical protein
LKLIAQELNPFLSKTGRGHTTTTKNEKMTIQKLIEKISALEINK